MASSLLPSLREQVSATAENRPGVYRFYGPGGELLYVGKSVRVRGRLLSYFRAPRGEKAWEMIRETARIEWEDVPNEFGALLSEMRLIQRHRPKYNVQHKRKRAYAFVKVTREPAPRVLPVGGVSPDDAAYFGPFPRVGRVAETIRDLAYVQGLRDCPGPTPVFFDDQLEMFRGDGPAGGQRTPRCMRGELGTCLAPCAGGTSSTTYRQRVEEAVRFLEGRGSVPLRRLEERMARAVRDLDFEYAARVRDRLERLRWFGEELAGWRGRVESLTFAYRVPGFRGADRMYVVCNGLVRDALPWPKSGAQREAARARVRAAVGSAGTAARRPAAAALTPHEAAEILFVARWFRVHERELERTRPLDPWLASAPTGVVSPGGPSASPAPTRPSPRAGRTDASC